MRFLYNKNGSWSLNSILFVIGSVILFIFSLFIMKKALEGGVDLKNGLHTTRLIIYHIKIWQLSWRGATGGIGGGIQIPETKLQALLPFPSPPPEHPGQLAPRLIWLIYLFLTLLVILYNSYTKLKLFSKDSDYQNSTVIIYWLTCYKQIGLLPHLFSPTIKINTNKQQCHERYCSSFE